MKPSDDLDRAARDIIREGRKALDPPPAIRDRVRQRVLLELAVSAATTSVARTLLAQYGKWVAATALLGTTAGAVAYWQSTPEAESPRILSTSVTKPALSVRPPPPAPDASAEPERAALPPQAANSAAPARSAAQAPKRASDLAREVELLAAANAALNRGDHTRARKLLSEYDKSFGAGVLREERAAAETLLICAAGDVTRSNNAAARFIKRWPSSPLKLRIERACLGVN
ncbi:MAG: hypothetical protein ACOY0T_29695 [Myxococcota bacterium]